MTAFSDYEAAVVRAQRRHPEWRAGQTAFNVLHRLHPRLAAAADGGPFDPFSEDLRLPVFLGWVERCLTTAAERRATEEALLRNIRARLPALRNLLEECDGRGRGGSEDAVYRFYHQSSKVYDIQLLTGKIVAEFENLLPGRLLNGWFMTIIEAGTGKTFRASHNKTWLLRARPLLEAFWHAQYMLAMVVRYGEELSAPPDQLPSGWAAVLYLYDLR